MHKKILNVGAIVILALCLSLSCYLMEKDRYQGQENDIVADNSSESEDTQVSVSTEDKELSGSTEGIDSSENTEDTGNTEDVENTEDTESTESTEDIEDTENSENTEVIEDTEDTEDTENAENSEDKEDVESNETPDNSGNSNSDVAGNNGLIVEPLSGTRYVNTYGLNIRSGPSTEYPIVGQLSMNCEVQLISKNQTHFVEIRFGDITGYVHESFLSETKTTVQTGTVTGSSYDHIENLQLRVAQIAKDNKGTRPCTGGMCAAWVSGIYSAAGLGYPGGNAIDYWTRWGSTGSTSMDNIPVGAVVCGSGSGSALGNQYGHVGIYLGNGLVADNVGYHRIISIEDWAKYNVGTCSGYTGYIGWVWPYGTSLGDLTN
ncbi:MAG: SH3 domain-containing protein [Agathobacter sp.]|nr:SH3 domain-containing protein [Agathobacter sp.]